MDALLVLLILVGGAVLGIVLIVRLVSGPGPEQKADEDVTERPPGRQSRPSIDPYEHRSGRYLNDAEAGELFVPGEDRHVPVRIDEGAFVHIGTGRLASPGNRHLTRLGAHSFNVRGAKYYPAAVLAANTSPGTPAILHREPDNPHDENAVSVVGLDDAGAERRVGYVNKGLARRLAKRLDAGETVDAWFMRGCPADEDYDGVAVLVTDPETKSELFGWDGFVPRRG